MKQNIRSLATLVLAAALLMALTACGPSTPNPSGSTASGAPSQSSSSSDDPGKTDLPSYEFLGEYHELLSFGMDFYLLGKMDSDGTGVIYMAQGGKRDGTPSVSYEETPVTWSQDTDRDGLVTFTAKSQGGGNDFGSVTLYQESDGTFQWEYTFQFSGGYSRTITMTGTSSLTYATADEWKSFAESSMFSTEDGGEGEGEGEGETGGESREISFSFYGEEVKQTDGTVCANMGAQIDLYADGTAAAMRGYAMGGSVVHAYSTDEGTWTQEGDALTIVIAGKTYTVEKNGDGYAFTWETSSEEEGALTVDVTAVQ